MHATTLRQNIDTFLHPLSLNLNLIILFAFVLHIVHIVHIIISYRLQREQNIEFNIPSMFNLVQKLIQTILDLSIYSYS